MKFRSESEGVYQRTICASKEAHLNAVAANRVIKSLRKRHGGNAKNMQAYRCPVCGNWHVGHAKSHRIRNRVDK